MLVVDNTLAAGVVICSLMVGIGSLKRIGRVADWPSVVAGLLSSPSVCFEELAMTSDSGE